MSSARNSMHSSGTKFALSSVLIAVCVITLSTAITASEPCVEVAIPPLSSKTGVATSVPVTVTEMTGLGAKSADFTITYDDSVIDFTGAVLGTVGDSNEGSRTVTVLESVSGTVVVSVFGLTEFQGSGALVNLNFDVIGHPATVTAVSFSSFMFNEGDPCDNTTNGSVTVQSGSISGRVIYGNAFNTPLIRAVPGVLLNAVGSIAQSDITGDDGIYSLSGMGADEYTVTPSKSGDLQGAISGFDASDVAVHAVGGTPQLTGNQAIVADVSGNGSITSFDAALIATFAANLPDTELTGTWRFLPVSTPYDDVNIDYIDQDYVALLMGDVSGNWDHPSDVPNITIETEGDPLMIAAAKLNASSGTTLTVPVTIGQTTGLGIRAYEFDLHYNADVLEPALTATDLAGTVSGGRVLTVNATQKGVLRVVTFGAIPLEGQGVLLKLRFNIIGAADSSSVLRWENFRLNEGGINFKTNNGEVNVLASAESGVINGRLLDPRGYGVSKSMVTVTDTQGNRRSVMSSSLGYFQVSELQVGETYTVWAASRRYRFAPQAVSITGGNAVELQMIALE